MILASNSTALDYRGMHPNLDLALERITPEFLSSLGEERVELKGEEVYCTRFTYETVPEGEAFFEAHRLYLDIHLMLSGSERVEIASPAALEQFGCQGDFYAYADRGGTAWSCPPAISWWCSPTTPTRSKCGWTALRP